MTVSYQTEAWSAVLPELQPLLVQQWEEIALDRDKIPYDPNWQRYRELEAQGALHVTTARDEGRLVGWYITIVATHPHYQTTLFGFLDIYYVLRPYRRGTVGIGLFAAMEQAMRDRGVVELISIAKFHIPTEPLFDALKWRRTGVTYTKILG